MCCVARCSAALHKGEPPLTALALRVKSTHPPRILGPNNPLNPQDVVLGEEDVRGKLALVDVCIAGWLERGKGGGRGEGEGENLWVVERVDGRCVEDEGLGASQAVAVRRVRSLVSSRIPREMHDCVEKSRYAPTEEMEPLRHQQELLLALEERAPCPRNFRRVGVLRDGCEREVGAELGNVLLEVALDADKVEVGGDEYEGLGGRDGGFEQGREGLYGRQLQVSASSLASAAVGCSDRARRTLDVKNSNRFSSSSQTSPPSNLLQTCLSPLGTIPSTPSPLFGARGIARSLPDRLWQDRVKRARSSGESSEERRMDWRRWAALREGAHQHGRGKRER